MRTGSRAISTIAAISVIALVVAGCGSSYSSNSSTTDASSAAPAAAKSGAAASLAIADNPELGQILTDGDGNTVYLFEKDEVDESYCSGECATAWPPLATSGDGQAGDGLDSSLISTIQREDGTEQVAYDGHPLYVYQGDAKPGDATGNEVDQFGAEWYALTPAGENAEGAAGAGSTEAPAGSGSTY